MSSSINTPKLRWTLVLPIALIIFCAATLGLTNGTQTAAHLAYTKRNYQEALKLYTQTGDHSGCGMVLLALNRPEDAAKYFELARDRRGLGLCALKKHAPNKAMEHFTAARDMRGLGLTYLALRDQASATAAFSRVNDWSGLGLVALAKQHYEEARRCFKKVGDHSGLGLTALKERNFTEALQQLTEARDESGLGLTYLAMRNYEKAAERFRKLNDLSGLGQVALARGQYKLAEQYFIEANDQNGLGDLYAQLHQFAKARKAFEQDHNPVKVIQSYRNDYTLPNRFPQALAYGEHAVADGRMAPECQLEIADMLYDLGRSGEALALLDRAAALPGYAAEAHLRKGRIYFYLRDLARAKSEFLQVQPDAFEGDRLHLEAQQALQSIASYQALSPEQLKQLQPAQSF